MDATNDTDALAPAAEPRTPMSTPASGPASPGVTPAHQCRQCRASFCQPLGCGHVYCNQCVGLHHICPECDRHTIVPSKPSSEHYLTLRLIHLHLFTTYDALLSCLYSTCHTMRLRFAKADRWG
ncbi:hypothetical protein CORC01_12469 [Colletotrichum orchidophilum]|uniref:RING-type domain-containing protein n=1 Tax=Colletotrichum orchidophilum TaxID=1209926 RepID=A0A1G4AT19_9PEZI|nr:uncharacterized protein CORC01_12469 [Colletotrichum orchidophilum]OHE92233.1 hypothetical protein CORC01_12469 [Colletotrichum orchidophilum]